MCDCTCSESCFDQFNETITCTFSTPELLKSVKWSGVLTVICRWDPRIGDTVWEPRLELQTHQWSHKLKQEDGNENRLMRMTVWCRFLMNAALYLEFTLPSEYKHPFLIKTNKYSDSICAGVTLNTIKLFLQWRGAEEKQPDPLHGSVLVGFKCSLTSIFRFHILISSVWACINKKTTVPCAYSVNASGIH